MKLKASLTTQEKNLFKEAVGKVKPIVQDKILRSNRSTVTKKVIKEKESNKQNAEFYFSDDFEPYLNQQGPVKYIREDVDTFEAKKLRRGSYSPDLILDLHGLDQQQAKLEISALLFACQKEHAHCICIIHGLGSRILKNKVPHWLVQHPDVMAFHQAPLEWGGNGAILALIEIEDKFS